MKTTEKIATDPELTQGGAGRLMIKAIMRPIKEFKSKESNFL